MSAKRQLAELAKRRTAPAEERREQLILATIRCVADHGLADTTIATVAQAAGLSQGIVNLHFRSKDGLLAMVELDFRRGICSRDKLAVWFAFWGERRFRPTYRRICAERDRSYDDMVRLICARLCKEGGYANVEPGLVADGLSALTDGLWLDLLVRPESMSRERAKRISLSYLADVFPRHFSQPAAEG